MTYQITIMDPEAGRARDTATLLRRLLNREGIDAKITEISCYLEISRNGYKEMTPAVLLDGNLIFSGKPVMEKHLNGFVNWLKNL